MNPPGPTNRGPNLLTLTLPSASISAAPRKADIQTAAVIEIKLIGLIDQAIHVGRRSKIEPAVRHAANGAGFRGQCQIFDDFLLVGDVGHAFRHADAQIDELLGLSSKAARRAMIFLGAHFHRRNGGAWGS